MNVCVHCGCNEIPDLLPIAADGICLVCGRDAYQYAIQGLVELEGYLGKVAAFQCWCATHEVAA